MGDFATVFPGWNVWTVYQVKDLSDTNPLFWGLDRERRLRIWVEDKLRLGAAGAVVADPVDLKGGQIEILPSPPTDLSVIERKEGVGGASALIVDGPADLRTVRFFNRGAPSKLVWPHDDEYLLNEVFQPSPKAQSTSGPAPTTITNTVGSGVAGAASGFIWKSGLAVAAAAALALYIARNSRR